MAKRILKKSLSLSKLPNIWKFKNPTSVNGWPYEGLKLVKFLTWACKILTSVYLFHSMLSACSSIMHFPSYRQRSSEPSLGIQCFRSTSLKGKHPSIYLILICCKKRQYIFCCFSKPFFRNTYAIFNNWWQLFQKDSTFINMIDYIFLIIVILGQSNEPLDLRFRLGSFYLESVLWGFFKP